MVLEESNFGGSKKIYMDPLTGIKYLSVTEGYAGGLTPLLGPDGKPAFTPKDKNPEF